MDTKAPVGATIATTTIRRSYAAEVKPYCKLDDVDHPDLKCALNESRSLVRIYTEVPYRYYTFALYHVTGTSRRIECHVGGSSRPSVVHSL
jgi:hypothetical protein